jgi:hypothetical protein
MRRDSRISACPQIRHAALTAMPQLDLSIDGDCCGPLSVGTVAVIRAIGKHLELSLAEATEFVNRCVFDGERVSLPAPTRSAAEALLAEFARLPAAPRLHASLRD